MVGVAASMAEGARLVQAERKDNLLIEGRVKSGRGRDALEGCTEVAEGMFETAFVEHAYIEPEAGWARRVDDRIEVNVTTQTPYMDRDEVANVMKLDQ